ncbi:MAG: AAA-like domain-containing protein [Prochloraceae cyanobacterium]
MNYINFNNKTIEYSDEALVALNFLRSNLSKRQETNLNDHQITIFVMLWDNSEINYEEIGEITGRTGRSVGDAARGLYEKIQHGIPDVGKIDRYSFKSSLKSCLEKKSSKKLQTNQNTPENFLTKVISAKNLNQSNLRKPQIFSRDKFYITRENEELALKQLSKPGGLVRLEGAEQKGKTLSMISILSELNDCYIIYIDPIEEATKEILQDVDNFFLWFCRIISRKLFIKAPSKEFWEEFWDDDFGGKSNAGYYLEDYLLPQLDRPLILAIDNLRSLFEHPIVANDVLRLFRAWYDKAEKAPQTQVAQKLRLILAYRENPLSLEQENSPFNVGYSIYLSDFKAKEILSLASLYKLTWQQQDAETLLSKTGGNPSDVRAYFKKINQKAG